MKSYFYISALIFGALVLCGTVHAQDDAEFTWSELPGEVSGERKTVSGEPFVETQGKQLAVSGETQGKQKAGDEEFDWVSIDGDAGSEVSGANTPDEPDRSSNPSAIAPATADLPIIQSPSSPSPAASEAYGELLRENLNLRKKIGELSESSEDAQKAFKDAISEKEKLVAVVQNLESSLTDMTTRIDTIKKERAESSENLDRTVELEQLLAKAEKEKAQMMKDLEAASSEAVDKESKVKAGSDLFKQIEDENVKLKTKLVEIETARRDAESKISSAQDRAEKESREAARIREQAERELKMVKEKEDRLNKDLAEARSQDKNRQKVIDNMLKEMPELEKELVQLTAEVVEKEAVLGAKDKDIELLRSELQRRDHRFVKAERMAELLDQAREEVKQVSNVEKRDMHYNMAVVYAKEGKLRDAEREYLRALKLDPTDPAVHYNLGILYEDEFNDKTKAVLHYKKYVQLDPFASDIDQVKQWLLDIEMGR